MPDFVWSEETSNRYSDFCQAHFANADLFELPTLKRLRSIVDLSRVRSMLSIGCGDGQFESSIMKHYPIATDFVEPSSFLHGKLTQTLAGHRGPGLIGRVFNGRFEDFATEARYDLIMAIHSF